MKVILMLMILMEDINVFYIVIIIHILMNKI